MKRCAWAKDQVNWDYHDTEWGTPLHDDQTLFEFLILEGAQAGLSWTTILKKRDAYRKAYDQFDPNKVAKYDENKVQELLSNAGIVRNRLKIRSSIKNAQIYLDIQKEFGSFDAYVWGFVNGKTINIQCKTLKDVPVTTPESDNLSKDLKKRGMSFVGSTIMYAFMQATGMVNDHETSCFRYKQV